MRINCAIVYHPVHLYNPHKHNAATIKDVPTINSPKVGRVVNINIPMNIKTNVMKTCGNGSTIILNLVPCEAKICNNRLAYQSCRVRLQLVDGISPQPIAALVPSESFHPSSFSGSTSITSSNSFCSMTSILTNRQL